MRFTGKSGVIKMKIISTIYLAMLCVAAIQGCLHDRLDGCHAGRITGAIEAILEDCQLLFECQL